MIKIKYSFESILILVLTLTTTCFSQHKVVDFSFYENKKLGPLLMESTFYIYDPLDMDKSGTAFVLAHRISVDTLSKIPDSTFYNDRKKSISNS